jgi:protein ImuB
MRRILCLYLPDWPIQCLLAARSGNRWADASCARLPHPPPVLLHACDPRRGDLVVAANRAAYERGVRLQMPLAEAAALAQHGGECLILPHDPAADLAALARLAEHCERFSPIVGWETAEGGRRAEGGGRNPGPDCLFLDVAGIGVLFGGEANLAREVSADLARLGCQARVAVADTIGAAWAAASQKDSPDIQVLSTQYSVLSTEPSEFQPTPDDQFPLFRTPSTHASAGTPALRTLPINSLRLPPEIVDLLAALGIVRLEQLLVLPRESLRARFGERLLLRIDQLLGTAQETIVAHRPPPQFVDEWLLEYPEERREAIEQIVRGLVHRVASALANRREGVLKLACRLDCAPGRPLWLEVGLFRPSAEESHLWDLVRMQLEQARLPGPVGRVRLEATLTAPLENRQAKLFAGGEHEAARQFALLVDRCSSRLGPEAVLCPQLTADPLPERAARYVAGIRVQGSRFGVQERGRKSEVRKRRKSARHSVLGPQYTVHSPKCRPSSPTSDSLHSPLLRPLALYSPPLELDVVSIAPDGPPVSFRFQDAMHHVTGRWGPERIETGWWRGKSIRRDYWRVETTTRQRFWLFRQLADGQWYLHGEYA